MLTTLAGRIAIIRRKRGLSLRALAAHLGFSSPQTVLNWEAGRRRPQDIELHWLAAALGVPADLLTKGSRDLEATVAALTPAKAPGLFMTAAEVAAAKHQAAEARAAAAAAAAERFREGRRKAGETNRARRAAERAAREADMKERDADFWGWVLRRHRRRLGCDRLTTIDHGWCSRCVMGGPPSPDFWETCPRRAPIVLLRGSCPRGR